MSILRLGKLMTMDERFEVIGKPFNGYIGDFIRLLEAIEPCETIKEATAVLSRFEKEAWLDQIQTMEMLEAKVVKLF